MRMQVLPQLQRFLFWIGKLQLAANIVYNFVLPPINNAVRPRHRFLLPSACAALSKEESYTETHH
jgi:hypothetical protein